MGGPRLYDVLTLAGIPSVRLLFRVAVFVVDIPKSPVGKILRRLLVAGEYRTE
jgi:acyl-coenzyme A synthetase/AMP-(fatty) acid ligase